MIFNVLQLSAAAVSLYLLYSINQHIIAQEAISTRHFSKLAFSHKMVRKSKKKTGFVEEGGWLVDTVQVFFFGITF